ncbi:MAG: hypothetical protein PHT44_02680 [Candidatus Portnoybacteria bacterium]|nr:hypothetical protein [Candidatus Portnoybacteria bacterium]MDD4982446.1 hypothetical protein [Candidatus Portnoybacteria bacterium]
MDAKEKQFGEINTVLAKELEHHARPGRSMMGPRFKMTFYFSFAHLSDGRRINMVSKVTGIPVAELREYREFRKTEIPRLLKKIFLENPDLAPSNKEIQNGSAWGDMQPEFSKKMSVWAKKTSINFHIIRAVWDETLPSKRQKIFGN